ncbi:MAG: hypothetical protein NW200_01705 [Hyphomonadaceae bacterium]|nr:hypothetical protein [Hyphomonadaceae bacterium]
MKPAKRPQLIATDTAISGAANALNCGPDNLISKGPILVGLMSDNAANVLPNKKDNVPETAPMNAMGMLANSA